MRCRIAIATLVAWLIPAALPAQSTPRPADPGTILRQMANLKPPVIDASRARDPAYIESFQHLSEGYHAARSELARTFVENYPNHPQFMQVMLQRWDSLRALADEVTIEREAKNVLAIRTDPKERTEALFVLADLQVKRSSTLSDDVAGAIQRFIDNSPKDHRGAQLLYELSLRDSGNRMDVLRELAHRYPDTDLGRIAIGQIHKIEGIGKPFELVFTDAISGKSASLQRDLKGRIVVLDFWATWCDPCVKEMPELKRIYAKYHNLGVEFIGISLDHPQGEGGLKALRDFVKKNEIPWPQYYQGNGFDSEFSSGWGVSAIPATFIIDKNGLLATTEARGLVDVMIKELLDGKKIDPRPNPLAAP